MKRVFLSCVAFLLFTSMASAAKLEIQAAANLSNVLEDIKKEFLKEHKNDSIDISYGASGQIYAKLTKGLYADLFLSADENFPKKLHDEKLSSEPVVYTQGVLVLWSNGDVKVDSLDSMLNAKNIALPNPQTAPYGRAAEEVLNNTKMMDKVKSKIVQGSSISQANQFVLSHSAPIGFNALSMVKNQKDASIYVVDDKLYEPITQAMVIMNNTKEKKLSKEFFDFVLSPKAQEIFKNYGYKEVSQGKDSKK